MTKQHFKFDFQTEKRNKKKKKKFWSEKHFEHRKTMNTCHLTEKVYHIAEVWRDQQDDNMALITACHYRRDPVVASLLQCKHFTSSTLEDALLLSILSGSQRNIDAILHDKRFTPSIVSLNWTSVHHWPMFKHLCVQYADRISEDRRLQLFNSCFSFSLLSKQTGPIDFLLDQFHNTIDMSVDKSMIFCIKMIKSRVANVLIAMQSLHLPALVSLKIINALIPNKVTMFGKWKLITLIKHFTLT